MKLSPLLPVLCLVILPLDTLAVKPGFPSFSGLKKVLFGSSSGSSESSFTRLRPEDGAESSTSSAFRLPETYQPPQNLHLQVTGEGHQGGTPADWQAKARFLNRREQNYIAKLLQPERARTLMGKVNKAEVTLLGSLEGGLRHLTLDQETSIEVDARAFLAAYDQARREYPDSLLVRSPALFRTEGLLDGAESNLAPITTDVHWRLRDQMLNDAFNFLGEAKDELLQKIRDFKQMSTSRKLPAEVLDQQRNDIRMVVARHNGLVAILQNFAITFERGDITSLRVKLD